MLLTMGTGIVSWFRSNGRLKLDDVAAAYVEAATKMTKAAT
jgi:hypothetical protein